MTAVSSQPVRGSRFPTLEKYDVLEEVGHGGMATVYRARDLRLGRDVAVKVIHPHLRDSAEAVRRFSIEARAVAKLRHPNIVEVYDVSGPTEAEQYLVVELLRGVTLRRLLEQHGALPAEVAASICVELLGALAHAHDAGVIHRDVKPENVILEHRAPPAATPLAEGEREGVRAQPPAPEASPSGSLAAVVSPSRGTATKGAGERITIKLTDFGIAKLLDAQGVTSTGQVLGSPAHMAPEQIEGREVDGRADVFGIGVLLYECMVGHLPFQGQNPAQVLRRVLEGEYPSAEHERPTVGRAWSRILDEALAASVEARFATAPEMREALLRELGRLGVDSPRREIEAWLDDPPGFVRAHDAEMTRRLCAKGEEASRKGDVLAAAADYNRALAYSPSDAGLLKIVSRMNRSRARRDSLRKGIPYAIAGLALLGVGIGVRSSLHPRLQTATDAADLPMSPPPATAVVPTVIATPLALPPEAASARTLAHPQVGPRVVTPPKPTLRELRFSEVSPPYGALVSIDGAKALDVTPAKPLSLDEKAHTLTFTCMSDLCTPEDRKVEPGSGPVSLPVHLKIKPALLVIHGNPGADYVDDDGHHLQRGDTPNPIPMTNSGRRAYRVTEVGGASQTAELVAGKQTKLDFGSAP